MMSRTYSAPPRILPKKRPHRSIIRLRQHASRIAEAVWDMRDRAVEIGGMVLSFWWVVILVTRHGYIATTPAMKAIHHDWGQGVFTLIFVLLAFGQVVPLVVGGKTTSPNYGFYLNWRRRVQVAACSWFSYIALSLYVGGGYLGVGFHLLAALGAWGCYSYLNVHKAAIQEKQRFVSVVAEGIALME